MDEGWFSYGWGVLAYKYSQVCTWHICFGVRILNLWNKFDSPSASEVKIKSGGQ